MLNKIGGGNKFSNNFSLDDENIYNVDCINEKCFVCQRHFIRIEDVRIGIDNDQYYHDHCAKELGIVTGECKDF